MSVAASSTIKNKPRTYTWPERADMSTGQWRRTMEGLKILQLRVSQGTQIHPFELKRENKNK